MVSEVNEWLKKLHNRKEKLEALIDELEELITAAEQQQILG